MERLLLFLIVFVVGGLQMNAQVGIGTDAPNPSSQLEIVAQDKGVLIPQIALESSTDQVSITSGNVESLLVYNTQTIADISPGYYYWYQGKWRRIAVSEDSLSETGITLTDNGDGSYTLTKNNGDTITVHTGAGSNPYDNTTSGLTSDNVQDAIDEVINNMKKGGGITQLTDNGDGTMSLTSDNGDNLGTIDKTAITDNGNGTYTLDSGNGNPVTIDTNAGAIAYDNNASGLTSDNAQGAIDELVQTIENNKGTLTVNGGLEFATGTNGIDKLLEDAGIQIADGGITSSKIEDGAVTSGKIRNGGVDEVDLAPDAVSTDKIQNSAVTNDKVGADAITTDKIVNGGVMAEDLGADPTDAGMVGVVQSDGSIVYQNIAASNVDGNSLTAGDGSITVVDGTGATLVDANVSVAADGITTDKIATGAVQTTDLGADAVTNDKLADNAVNTENITDGAVEASDINPNVAGDGLTQNATTGVLEVDVTALTGDGSITSSDLTVTGGANSTFEDVALEIAPEAVGTDELANDAVTNDKLADNAVSTENITDGTIATDDLGNGSVTAEKMNSGTATAGQLPIADGSGGIAYGNVAASNVDGQDFTSNDLTITNGTGATLTAVTAEITDGAVDTDALAPDAVTNDKLADNAVNTENITDGTITTDDLGNGSVTAEKMNSETATAGQLPIADGGGGITYGNVAASNVDGNDLTAGDGSITVVDGTGATLVDANVSVAADGITTDKIAAGAVQTADLGADAVTNDKLADNAVSTENITDGAVSPNKMEAGAVDQVMTTNPSGTVEWVDQDNLQVTADNGLTKTSGNVQLGGALINPTTITAEATNTLAIAGLQTGTATDNLVVADPNTGVLKQVNSAMPKWFYMPSIVFDTSVTGTGITRNLHNEYIDQFTGTGNPTLVGSTGAPADIPNLPTATDLYYYVTYYDTAVFDNVSIDANGILSYDIISATNSASSFMNIVFVVK